MLHELDHTALRGRARERIGGRGVLGGVKAFPKAGVLSEDERQRATFTGGILSPLLANIGDCWWLGSSLSVMR